MPHAKASVRRSAEEADDHAAQHDTHWRMTNRNTPADRGAAATSRWRDLATRSTSRQIPHVRPTVAESTSSAETDGIRVRVQSHYLADQSSPRDARYVFAYTITISNESARTAQLRTRHWIITDGRGARHSVEGEGVVGEQPLIAPGESYDYVSGCPLATPTGNMQGTYRMIGEDGAAFDVTIPKFGLLAPAVET
jgi:ApaG protein